MITVGIRELRQQVSEIIRSVHEEGSRVEITLRGKPVAMLVPIRPRKRTENHREAWTNLDSLAAKIGAEWPEGLAATDALAEDRE